MYRKLLRSITMILLIATLMTAFAACEQKPGEGNATSDKDAVTTVQETESETEAPNYSEMKSFERKRVQNTALGIRVAKIENSNPYVVLAEATRHYLMLYAYETGTAVLELTDYFGHTAKATVTVDAENEVMDVQIEKCTDEFIEVGLDFQAQGIGASDDTESFQKAVDSAKPGDTVYVYPGRYNVSLLVMREGVTLQMYTTMTEASEGYSKRLEDDFNNNRIAILSGTRIQNNGNQERGAEGCSNFSIIGGAIDTNHTTRSTLIFGCADNVRVENVLFKDIKGNHTIQLTGCTNTIVENCMFAGYTCGDAFTREIIQVEPSTPGATGTAATAPLKFENGEYNLPENITIQSCYFGKSDEAGAPLMAIGHHSQVGPANVTGFYIKDNIFDEVLYAAIRYDNIVDVEITGNTFVSSAEYKNATQFTEAKTPAFIILYHHNGASTYTASDGKKVTKATAVEQAGLHNIKIENNTFTLKKGSDKQIMVYKKTSCVPGATYTDVTRQDKYNLPTYSFSGYSVNNNYASDISFSNNTINIEGQPTYKTHYIALDEIYDLKFENNKINLASGVVFSNNSNGYEKGQVVFALSDTAKGRITVAMKNSEKTITIKCGDTAYVFKPQSSGTLAFNIGNGGVYDMDDDGNGNIIITLTAVDGYTLDKVAYSNGSAVSSGVNTVNASMGVNVSFKK